MKIRNGFVSNSSSSSFIITNKTSKPLSLVSFVKEFGEELLKEFNDDYDGDDTFSSLIKCAEIRDEEFKRFAKNKNILFFKPGENETSFGDEDGDTLGRVFDYALRDNPPNSKTFSVRFNKHMR